MPLWIWFLGGRWSAANHRYGQRVNSGGLACFALLLPLTFPTSNLNDRACTWIWALRLGSSSVLSFLIVLDLDFFVQNTVLFEKMVLRRPIGNFYSNPITGAVLSMKEVQSGQYLSRIRATLGWLICNESPRPVWCVMAFNWSAWIRFELGLSNSLPSINDRDYSDRAVKARERYMKPTG